MTTLSRFALLTLVAFPLCACTHSMQIKNLKDYVKRTDVQSPLRIGLKDGALGGEGQQFFKFVYEAMRQNPGVKEVLLPTSEGWGNADAVVTIRSHAAYDGSGWNFLVTFPGFLIFTHAWNGFVYKANVATEVSVELPQQTPIATSIRTDYSLRHCDFGRGAAASSGWYLPGWGGTNIIIGLFMIRYDSDATPEFMEKVRAAYGEYITNSILELIVKGHSEQADPAKVSLEPTGNANWRCS